MNFSPSHAIKGAQDAATSVFGTTVPLTFVTFAVGIALTTLTENTHRINHGDLSRVKTLFKRDHTSLIR